MAKTKSKTGEEARPWDDIGIGDLVKHPTWGDGTVLFRSGSGDEAKAIVVFSEEGQKKLMLKFAKLKKVGSAPKPEPAAKKPPKPKIVDPDDLPLDDEPLDVPADVAEDDEEAVFGDDEEEELESRAGQDGYAE